MQLNISDTYVSFIFNQFLCFKQKLVENVQNEQIQPTAYAELTSPTYG